MKGRLLTLGASIFMVGVALVGYPASASAVNQTTLAHERQQSVLRHEAQTEMQLLNQANQALQLDEGLTPQTTSLAALTHDTTQYISQLQALPTPPTAATTIRTLLHTWYKVNYDAAALQPVVDTTDHSLATTLGNQVTADLSVMNADLVASLSALNPLAQPPPPVVHSHRAITEHRATATSWRDWKFIQEYVIPATHVGWVILSVLTGLMMVMMVFRLFRRTHGMRP